MLSDEEKLEKMMKKLNPTLKDSLIKMIEPVKQIWGTDLVLPDYTRHGTDHSMHVIGYSYDILDSHAKKINELNEYEMYLLLASIFLHDIGMQCYPSEEIFSEIIDYAKKIADEKKIPFDVLEFRSRSGASLADDEKESIRRYHSLLTKAMIIYGVQKLEYETLHDACKHIPDELVDDLSDICLYHSKYPIMDCDEHLSILQGRKRLIAVILRLADELDISRRRINENDYKILRRDPKNLIYWLKHKHTSVVISDNLIRLKLTLHPEDAKNYGRILQASIINDFCCKNKKLIEILNIKKFDIKLDDEKSRKDGILQVVPSYGAKKIPDEVLLEFKRLEREEKFISQFRYRHNITNFYKNIEKEILNNNYTYNILVLGDVMLDHVMYTINAPYGQVLTHNLQKVSVLLREEDHRYKKLGLSSSERRTLGGTASLVVALLAIPNITIDVISIIGNDPEGKEIERLFTDLKAHTQKNNGSYPNFYPVIVNEYPTVTKNYYYDIEYSQGIVKTGYRFDREDKSIIDKKIEEYKQKLKIVLDNLGTKYDCIIIADHEKGMINNDIIDWVSQKFPYVPKYVDPKYNFDYYNDLYLKATIPNIKEASMGIRKIANISEDEIKLRGLNSELFDTDFDCLKECLPNCESFIVKADINGAVIYSKNNDNDDKNGSYYKDNICSFPIDESKVKDNIGCGDVFDAYFILSQLKGFTLEDSVKLANIAAGIKRKKELGDVVSPKEICEELSNFRKKCNLCQNT